MGTTCNVAKHCHLEVLKGKFIKPTKFTSLGFYKFDNAIEPFKALFVDDNTLIKYSRYEWINVNKENQELKKQLENKYEKIGTLTAELLYEENTKLINQQKEFIKYLQEKSIGCEITNKRYILEEILQKYKK